MHFKKALHALMNKAFCWFFHEFIINFIFDSYHIDVDIVMNFYMNYEWVRWFLNHYTYILNHYAKHTYSYVMMFAESMLAVLLSANVNVLLNNLINNDTRRTIVGHHVNT